MKQNLATNLMEQILAPANLNQAYKRVKSNRGAAGIDGMTVTELGTYLREAGNTLRSKLREGSFRPQAVRSVEIPKASGGVRKLGIPTVVDRLVQQAILQVLQPILDPTFSSNSYGYRPGKSAHDAILRAQEYVQAERKWVVDVDLEQFFDTVNHDILMRLLSEKVGDKSVLRLIRRYLKAGLMEHGVHVRGQKGVPQGGPLSPLLANVLLNEADRELESRGHKFVRYADDLQVYVKSRKAGERVLKSLERYFWRSLKLRVNQVKSECVPVNRMKYLGYGMLHDGTLILPRANEKRLRRKLRQLTKRHRGVSLERVIADLNRVISGWCNYYRYAHCATRLKRVDEWLRRRLRCYRIKQCKRTYTLMRFLRKHGVAEWQSWILALSGKSWWRKSSAPQVNQALSLKWFRGQGLLSLSERLRLLQTL